MLPDVFNEMFQYASNKQGYGTRYAAKQNLDKFGVRTKVGKLSVSFRRYRYLERPFIFHKRLNHFRLSQISQTFIYCVSNKNKIVY